MRWVAGLLVFALAGCMGGSETDVPEGWARVLGADVRDPEPPWRLPWTPTQLLEARWVLDGTPGPWSPVLSDDYRANHTTGGAPLQVMPGPHVERRVEVRFKDHALLDGFEVEWLAFGNEAVLTEDGRLNWWYGDIFRGEAQPATETFAFGMGQTGGAVVAANISPAPYNRSQVLSVKPLVAYRNATWTIDGEVSSSNAAGVQTGTTQELIVPAGGVNREVQLAFVGGEPPVASLSITVQTVNGGEWRCADLARPAGNATATFILSARWEQPPYRLGIGEACVRPSANVGPVPFRLVVTERFEPRCVDWVQFPGCTPF